MRILERKYRLATSGIRVLPNFIIIGATRSGTTSLYENLIRHPSVVRAFNKEPSFFNLHFQRGLGWYRAQFPLSWHRYYFKQLLRKEFSTGEASANYFYYPSVPERIHKTLPNVRLILLLRNPVDRAFSDYQLSVRSRKEDRSFEEAINNEMNNPVDLTRENEKEVLGLRYLLKGEYAKHLENWRVFFGGESLLVLRSEEFFSRQSHVFAKVLKHLGLPIWEPGEFAAFQAPGKRRNPVGPRDRQEGMNSDIRSLLVDYFRSSNQALSAMIGTNLDWDK